MGQPAAKQGDQVTATDNHLIQPPGPSSPLIVPHAFNGVFDGGLSANVNIMSRPAAVVGSSATNNPPHIPNGGSFINPAMNRGEVVLGSATVFINGKPAVRSGDTARTCNDPVEMPLGTVQATGTVSIGG